MKSHLYMSYTSNHKVNIFWLSNLHSSHQGILEHIDFQISNNLFDKMYTWLKYQHNSGNYLSI